MSKEEPLQSVFYNAVVLSELTNAPPAVNTNKHIPSRHVDTMCPESIFDRGEKFQISLLQFPSICAQECLHKL